MPLGAVFLLFNARMVKSSASFRKEYARSAKRGSFRTMRLTASSNVGVVITAHPYPYTGPCENQDFWERANFTAFLPFSRIPALHKFP